MTRSSKDAFVFIKEGETLRRTVSAADLQVGYPTSPSELHVTGRVSHSLKVVEVRPGGSYQMEGSTTVLCVKRSGTGSGAITVVLPGGPRIGQVCKVKDASGTAGSNNVVVSGGASKIDGSSARVLTNPYEFTGFAWTGDSWCVIGGYDVGADDVASLNATDASLQNTKLGVLGDDQQAFVSSGFLSITGLYGSWDVYGPTYTFNAPTTKQYLVTFMFNAWLNSISSVYYGLYAGVKNQTTGIIYGPTPPYWTAPVGQSVHGMSEVLIPMNAGPNVLQMAFFGDDLTDWRLYSYTYRRFLVKG